MMFPGYGHMDSQTQSFPEFMSYPYNCYPRCETVPLNMRVDTSMPPFSFGPCVSNGRNSYPGASECNGCCMHNHHPPGYYYYSPPYLHIQPPQHLYTYGAHPAYHGAFPYFVSPPYPFEQPPRDYDKAQSHCCGCPNHACQRMDNKGVKIEEQKPDIDPKGGDSSLMHLPSQTHPVVWSPFNHMKEKDQGNNSESQPVCWNEWIPSESNGLKGLHQPLNEHEVMHDKVKNPLQWPFIWMPGYNKTEQGAVKDFKELSTNPETTEESSTKLKVISMELLEDGSQAGKPGVPGDERKVQGRPESLSKKESRTKIISVKQTEENIEKKLCIKDKLNEEDQKRNCLTKREKEDGDDKKSRTKAIPVKQVEESSKEKPFTDVNHNQGNYQKNGSTKREKEDSDANKASGNKKFPPICLRVSPLPRKKSSNGSSPSSSPPPQNDIEKVHLDSQLERPSPKDTNCEVSKEVFQVTDARGEVGNQTIKKRLNCQDAVSTVALEKHQVNQGNSSLSKGAETSKLLAEAEVKRDENEGNKTAVRETEQHKSSEEKEETKTLSPVDAAILIQSACRGFDVRRWQPIQKLRNIRDICMQMEDVRKQIQDLEVVSDPQDKKRRMAVNESIMNLLLQLDTVQGMHQFVREARKSAARELVYMQEKLDALAKQADSVKVDEISDGAVGSENDVKSVNLQPTASYYEQNSSLPADDKVSQDLTNMGGSIRFSSEQDSNLEASTGSAELEANGVKPSDKYTLVDVQEEAPFPNKFSPEGDTPNLANQVPSSEDSTKPSMSEDSDKPSMSAIQGNTEACFISGNGSPFGEDIVEEDQVVDSQFESPMQGLLESHQRNEMNTSRLDSEEDQSEINVDTQEFVKHLPGEEQLDSGTKTWHVSEVINVQETSVLALAAESEDKAEKVVEVYSQTNNSEEPHTDNANVDHHLSENVRNTIEKIMDTLATVPGANVPKNVVSTENVVDSPVLDQLKTEISGKEGGIKAVEAPEGGRRLDFMRLKEEEVLESQAPEVPASKIQSTEEVIECSPLLKEVPQHTLDNTADIPRQVHSGLGVNEECISPTITGEIDAKPNEESLKITEHHDECASPCKEADGVASCGSCIMRHFWFSTGQGRNQLVKENEKLRQMLENLLVEGRAQIEIIHELNGRVKDLEKKLSSHRRKATAKRYRLIRPSSRKLAP